jgi:hypothetical protein
MMDYSANRVGAEQLSTFRLIRDVFMVLDLSAQSSGVLGEGKRVQFQLAVNFRVISGLVPLSRGQLGGKVNREKANANDIADLGLAILWL